jgi:putative addiction module component (TIGR02574 family)
MCRPKAWLRITLPVPVFLNRLDAPLWVFNFGIKNVPRGNYGSHDYNTGRGFQKTKTPTPACSLTAHPLRKMVCMARDAAEILEEALSLPMEIRAALIDSLLDSLDSEVDENAEELWQQEILHRIGQFNERAILPIPWSEVRTRLMSKVRIGG